jgi:hypothetical protein
VIAGSSSTTRMRVGVAPVDGPVPVTGARMARLWRANAESLL